MTGDNLNLTDKLLINIQGALETLFAQAISDRPYPAISVREEQELTDHDKAYSARLMRINHTGEVCAQALYRGQALTATDLAVGDGMIRAAKEEEDHLAWCETRLDELGGRTSFLNPLWYTGAFMMGAVAGAVGDKWSLGFVEETEEQVTKHLQSHLDRISSKDVKTKTILQQMQIDEQQHADAAHDAGAAELPHPIKCFMKYTSKVMTTTVYWI